MGPLLAEISRKMNQSISEAGENNPKILIHSTHDTAIAGLLGTLEVFDNRYLLAPSHPVVSQGLLGGLISRRL
jgi:hypothetical protein